MLLQGKTVVVSGVGAGLGHRIAETVVRDGGNAVLGARTEANLAKSAAEIDPEGRRTAYRATDITDEEQCAALASLAVERFGGVDAVVHVAAWDSYFGGLEDADFATWQAVLDVNLLGTLRMTRACLLGPQGAWRLRGPHRYAVGDRRPHAGAAGGVRGLEGGADLGDVLPRA